jgi:hypothetical protein
MICCVVCLRSEENSITMIFTKGLQTQTKSETTTIIAFKAEFHD